MERRQNIRGRLKRICKMVSLQSLLSFISYVLKSMLSQVSEKKDKQTTQFQVKDVAFLCEMKRKAKETFQQAQQIGRSTWRCQPRCGWETKIIVGKVYIAQHSTKNNQICRVKSFGKVVVINIRKFSKDEIRCYRHVIQRKREVKTCGGGAELSK